MVAPKPIELTEEVQKELKEEENKDENTLHFVLEVQNSLAGTNTKLGGN